MSVAAAEPRLAVLGPGLLGGSLALAAKQSGAAESVSLWGRRAEVVAQALRTGVADHASTDLAEAVDGATLIVLATPVEIMPALAAQLAALPLAPGTLITDVGSVKASVVAALTPILAASAATFVGSHPMAGSEKTGLEAARAELFEGAACILTPTAATPADAVPRLEALWRRVGCRVLSMSPERHDLEVARISHLPHLMAVVTTLAAIGEDSTPLRCAGNGFRDTTRVAGSDPGLWTGIVAQNRPRILEAVRAASGRLGELLEILESLDDDKLRQFLTAASQLRRQLPAPSAPDHGHSDR